MMRRGFVAAVLAGLMSAVPATVAAIADEDLRMGDDPAYFERVEVPEAGIAVSFPPDWEVEIELAPGQYDPSDPATEYVAVLYASAPDDGWCDITRYANATGDLAVIAAGLAENYMESYGDDSSAQATALVLFVGDTYRVDVQDPDGSGYTSTYMFEADGARYTMNCSADEREAHDWMDIAETLELLPPDGAPDDDASPDETDVDPADDGSSVIFSVPAYDLAPVEIPEVDITVMLPTDWDLEVGLQQEEYLLPPGYEDAPPASALVVLYTEAGDGDWCLLKVHEDNPLTLDEQAAWEEEQYGSGLSPEMTLARSVLPLGDGSGHQIDIGSQDGPGAARIYLLESGGSRYEVQCGSEIAINPAWQSIAESIKPLLPEPDATAPPSVPDGAASWSEVDGFESTIPVSGDAAMRAWCERALWIEFPDGSFQEQVECRLTDDPVDASETQGVRPDRRLLLEGGACEWVSDFWTAFDGSEVWASRWWVLIEPDGRVMATAEYAPEPLECEGD